MGIARIGTEAVGRARAFVLGTRRGSHRIMRRHPDGCGTTVPVHPGRDVAKGTLRGILSDVGMSIEERQRLL